MITNACRRLGCSELLQITCYRLKNTLHTHPPALEPNISSLPFLCPPSSETRESTPFTPVARRARTLNQVEPQLESAAWCQTLNLKCDFLDSKFAFQTGQARVTRSTEFTLYADRLPGPHPRRRRTRDFGAPKDPRCNGGTQVGPFESKFRNLGDSHLIRFKGCVHREALSSVMGQRCKF
jgi:hypothetical protein